MKYLIFIFLAFSQAPQNKEIIVRVKLLDYTESKMPAYCGYQVAYAVLKLQIAENIAPFKDRDTIFIIQECPRETMEKEVGKYINNQEYKLVTTGKEVERTLFARALRICDKEYSNDKPKKIFGGIIRNFK